MAGTERMGTVSLAIHVYSCIMGEMGEVVEQVVAVLRGQPAQFGVMGVIPGFSEGLQLMTVGSHYRFVIPSDMAYGSRGTGSDIGPNATLIFEIELLDVI